MLRLMGMRSGLLLACAMLAACTSTPDATPAAPQPTSQPPLSQEAQPPLALRDVVLTCNRRNERSSDGEVRGRVVGADAATAYEVAVVQGTDASLGGAALPDADAEGTASFLVAVTKVHTEQPVRVVLREAGILAYSELLEVVPDATTCSP